MDIFWPLRGAIIAGVGIFTANKILNDMNLSDIAINICALMPAAKANKRKCTFNICTTSEGSQYLYFTVFFNDCGEETNKSLVFYEFHTQEQHAEKLEKIEQFLNGQINAKELYNLGHFN